MVELEQAWFREDRSLDVLMSEPAIDLKALGKKLNTAGLVRETDKGDFAIPPRDGVVVKNKGLRQ
jgi:hypothetical protein